MNTAVTAGGRQVLPGLGAAVATVAVAAAGLRVSGLGVIDAIGFALVIAWAIAGVVLARAADRTAYWLIALGALDGAVALTAAQMSGQYQAAGQHAARVLATLAGTLVIAISFHFLLALPDGRLAGRGADSSRASATPARSSPGSGWLSPESRSRSWRAG